MKNKLYKTFQFIFTVTLPVFMIMGLIIVLTQIISIVTSNPKLVLGVSDRLKIPSIYIACIAGCSGFLANYLKSKI